MKNEQGHTGAGAHTDYIATVTLLIFLAVMIMLVYLALGTGSVFEALR